MRVLFRLWLVCSLLHLVAFGMGMFFACQIMDVSRQPSATTLIAIDVGRVLFFPATYLLRGCFKTEKSW